ncbi:MAG TPA: class IV adenylate cyclase [Pirellulales bacterium]|nr:class IV adenylate cyclase [Pirellulales bacterium]
MALEVEQKFPVEDVAALRAKLAALGAINGATDEQVDCYYAHPTRDFARTDEALRLRRVGPRNYVTYKGPKLDASTKTQREIELELPRGEAAAKNAAALFEALGFRLVADVEKRRAHSALTWQGHEITVSIDRIETLGDFVELEIIADEQTLDAARQAIATLAANLGLTGSERRSYLELRLGSVRAVEREA